MEKTGYIYVLTNESFHRDNWVKIGYAEDVEKRVRDFCKFLVEKYDGKKIAIVAHKAPQFALEVITKGITWEEAIEKDWRKTKAWQPGWEYILI